VIHPLLWLEEEINSREASLSPKARLIWLIVIRQAQEFEDFRLIGTVDEICSKTGLCDRTFKIAVDELLKLGLMKRYKRTTDLGAKSYSYRAIYDHDFSHAVNDHVLRLEDQILFEKPSEEKPKLTVQLRLLFIALLIVWFEHGCISLFQTSNLEQLTGLNKRSVRAGLDKLNRDQYIRAVCSANLKHKKLAVRDCN
jgi:hypothetical protein